MNRFVSAAAILVAASMLSNARVVAVAASPIVVKPSAMNGWYFWNDKNDLFTGSPGALVSGPAMPPLGAGSVRLGPLTDNGATAAGHSVIATNAYFGAPLASITSLSYWTYQPGPILATALQFDVRYRTTDSAYGGRLVFEPYQNGAVTVGSGWQSWSPLLGQWWATKTTVAGTGGAQVVALPAGNCAQATPCTWSQINAAFPAAVISGRFLLKAGSNWLGFDGNADSLTVGVSGIDTTYDFEPETACAAICYVDGATGNDAFGGDTPASAKKTIQAAINQVNANGEVRVLPGNYHESAPGSSPTSIGGTYQFGLFFGSGKPGIKLIGVTAADVPITDASATQATITTNATNNFGTDGVFVEAANTTIQGVKIGPNDAGDNKTIEVVADNFTLQFSTTDIPGGGGSVYIDDFSAGGTVVQSYHVLDNVFPDGTSIDLASGAGNTGPVAGREILRNTFDLGNNGFNAISFNGTGGVPWFANPVGGAIIKDNSFANSSQYIRARGVYDNGQFDWKSYWDDNTFDRAAVALVTEVPFDVRTYAYSVFTNVRRIGGTIQGEVQEGTVNHAVSGDTVLVKAGTYNENVTVNEDDLTIKGAGIGATVLHGIACGGTGIALTGNRSNLAIKLLTVTGFTYGITTDNIGSTVANILIEDVSASSNCVHGIWSQAGVTNGLTLRRVNASNNGGSGGRGFWIINGVKTNVTIEDGTFNNNALVGIDISDGNVTGLAITGNTVTGNGDSGIGVLGAKGPSANLVANNTVTNNGRFGIEIKIPTGNGMASGSGSVAVKDNVVTRTIDATDARDYAGIAVFRRSVSLPINANQPSGVAVMGNIVSGYHRKPVGSTGDGFGIVVEGADHLVTKNIVSGNDVGIQIQAGNTANLQSTAYFDRGDAAPSNALINRNSITGNTLYDLRNVGALAPTNSTCNWYGAVAGPVPAKVSGSFTTSPWLTTSNLDGACPVAAPVVATPAADAFGNEGQTLMTGGTFSGTGLNLTADNGAVGTFTDNGNGTWTWSMATTDDVALATITVMATDIFGQWTTDAFDYRALNVAPSLTITAPTGGQLYALGAPTGLASTFTDLGSGDTHSCAIQWDDSTSGTGLVVESSGNGSCAGTHTYLDAGVYTISVTVTDDNGGSDTKTVMVIVYDPSAGFVTGGGKVYSAPGAYRPNLSIGGEASFGFVSKYPKGKIVPTGNTEFQFDAASLNFHSTAYEWLVVTGNKAQYRGSGTVNGVPGYTFKLTAWDVSGGDKIRMQIWDTAAVVIYDNKYGQSEDIDNASGVQGILSGSIVIHK